jgi:hypothetical protein
MYRPNYRFLKQRTGNASTRLLKVIPKDPIRRLMPKLLAFQILGLDDQAPPQRPWLQIDDILLRSPASGNFKSLANSSAPS